MFIDISKKYNTVFNKKMAYYDEGSGDPIVFLHGNPTSSYLWRNIAPNFIDSNRVIVPDLIGMGDSEKLDGINNEDYNFNGHYKFLDALLSSLSIQNNIHLVIHDWGCGLGLKYARLNSKNIASITFMEGMTVPLTWDQWPDAGTKIFKLFRSDAGEELILEKNFFVERLLLHDPLIPMTDQTKDEYRRPYLEKGESRRPTLTFPRNLPINDIKSDAFDEIKLNAEFHKDSNIPKLFINADPGFLLVGTQRDEIRKWSNLHEETVKGNHFIQEDSPEDITNYVKSFIENL